jgi:S-adenosylmethionine decarboxylase
LDPEGICTFRVDIDIATCGSISPLQALGLVFESFESDVVHIHYAVRGYIRGVGGKKIFLDHPIESLSSFSPNHVLDCFFCVDSSHPSSRSYQAVLRRKTLDVESYFREPHLVDSETKAAKLQLIESEIESIAQGLGGAD